MLSVIIVGLVAGILFVGGLPHIVQGVMGKSYAMPFGGTESAAASVVWGWVNWGVAVLLWHVAPMASHPRATFVAVAVGFLAAGLAMSGMRAKAPRRRAKEA